MKITVLVTVTVPVELEPFEAMRLGTDGRLKGEGESPSMFDAAAPVIEVSVPPYRVIPKLSPMEEMQQPRTREWIANGMAQDAAKAIAGPMLDAVTVSLKKYLSDREFAEWKRRALAREVGT